MQIVCEIYKNLNLNTLTKNHVNQINLLQQRFICVFLYRHARTAGPQQGQYTYNIGVRTLTQAFEVQCTICHSASSLFYLNYYRHY